MMFRLNLRALPTVLPIERRQYQFIPVLDCSHSRVEPPQNRGTTLRHSVCMVIVRSDAQVDVSRSRGMRAHQSIRSSASIPDDSRITREQGTKSPYRLCESRGGSAAASSGQGEEAGAFRMPCETRQEGRLEIGAGNSPLATHKATVVVSEVYQRICRRLAQVTARPPILY
jgi:hypothetical protein